MEKLECHCDVISDFFSLDDFDPVTDAGSAAYAEIDALITEDIAYHDREMDALIFENNPYEVYKQSNFIKPKDA